MKMSRVLLCLFPLCLYAQAPAPAAQRPTSPQINVSAGTVPPATAPSAPAAKVPDTAVVAKLNGKDVTAGEIRKLMAGAPPQVAQTMAQNPKTILETLYTMELLKSEAEKDKVTETSPFKEQLAFAMRQMLAQAEVAYKTNQISITEDEQRKRYEADKSKYEQAKIRVIYVSFADPKAAEAAKEGKKPLTETEAKAKAEDLTKKAKAGGDFAALAKDNSDDKRSAEKGGEFGFVRRGDKISEDIKKAVFSLKAGEISDPIRQPNGFYVIKVDEYSVRPFEDVKAEQFQEMRQEKFQAWLKTYQDQSQVTIENPDFFKGGVVAR